MARLKTLVWDIETTDLKADWGRILCIGYAWYPGRPTILAPVAGRTGRALLNDRDLVKRFLRIMQDADMQVTYYGKQFDLPYVTAKAIKYNLGPPPDVPHVDLYWTVRRSFAISRRRLESVAKFLKLRHKKTPVDGAIWQLAVTGDMGAARYVAAHCRADVALLCEAYQRLAPLVKLHPRMYPRHVACAVCGGTELVSQVRPTAAGARQRLWCRGCRAWWYVPLTPLRERG
jgi:uncharacterized protein YprB with RNaseH-like and TPR domain